MDGMKAGPSEDYVRLLRGEIEAEEYVKRLKAEVDARHGARPARANWGRLDAAVMALDAVMLLTVAVYFLFRIFT